jgi:uncharacterized NAD(P)/FAD-binding protein YdhS
MLADMVGSVVAIVGGGASGVLCALHLIRRAPAGARIVMIEPAPELGHGVAYGTTDPGHLLNVRAQELSAFPDQPDHFTSWARQRGPAEGSAFLPRMRYGAYLRSLAPDIEHIRARALHLLPNGSRVQIVLSDGIHCQADRVVLAPGASPSRWPAPLGDADPRWVLDPWREDALRVAHPGEPVLLVGTGLTAIDVALSLHAAGHRQIIATSRHGLLPAAHCDEPDPEPSIHPPGASTGRAVLAWARASAGETGRWGPVIDALRPNADRLWSAMPPGEQLRFLRHLHRYWEVLRHRMAPSVAARIEVMRHAGELAIVPGGVRAARTGRHGIHVTLADRRVRVGAVINCTGPTIDVRQTRHPLMRRLLDYRIVRPGPLALGLDTDADGRLSGAGDALWLIGSLRRGRLWETTSIPEIRAQADVISRALWRADVAVGA